MSTPKRAQRSTAFKGNYKDNSERSRATRTNNVLETDQGYKEQKITHTSEDEHSDNDIASKVHKQPNKKTRTHEIIESNEDSNFTENNDHVIQPSDPIYDDDQSDEFQHNHSPLNIQPNKKQTIDDSIHRKPALPTNTTTTHKTATPSIQDSI